MKHKLTIQASNSTPRYPTKAEENLYSDLSASVHYTKEQREHPSVREWKTRVGCSRNRASFSIGNKQTIQRDEPQNHYTTKEPDVPVGKGLHTA